jgi:transcriptional regulator with XRE-family HTH domain
MRTPSKATALVLAGAVGLASAAYGIGTQSGDGTATAARGDLNSQRSFERGAPPGLDELADTIGVEASELEDAMRDFHEQEHKDGRTAFAEALAKSLGKDASEVSDALEKLEEARSARFAQKLADELGIDADKVQSALDELRDSSDGPRHPLGLSTELAGKLGVSVEKLEDALFSLRPGPGGDHHHGRPGPSLRALASELGVTKAELRKALREVRSSFADGMDEKRSELAQFLADRFGVSVEKVEEALPEFAGPPGGPRGPGGGPDGGPGGHGFGGPPPMGP